MSLKAKIEAVIYASEEPVTLAQLTGLLGEEAQAELDAIAAQQQSLVLEDGINDADALNAEVIVSSDDSDEDEEAIEEAQAEAGEAPVDEEATPVDHEATPAPEADAPEPTAEEAAPAEALIEEPAPAETVAEEPASAPEPDARALAAQARARERKLREYFQQLVAQLIADYANDARGLEIREVAGGYRLATKPEYHDAVRGFVKSLKPPLKLSLQALETLAVVAYKQPVTAPEVSEIRGVDSGGVLGSLMTRKLVTTAGRKQVIGRPILYKTTKDFLVRFGLKDINELPSIEEFEKMAGELADMEPSQEEIPMEHEPHNLSEEEAEAGTSPSVDEINAAPEPTTTLHETVEEILSDKSAHLEGHNEEHADPHEVEPMAGIHSDQADGNVADDIIVDGRESALPPVEEDDDPSAEDAEIQKSEEPAE